MRIVVDAVAVEGGGGRTYLLNIMEALAAATPRHEYVVVLTTRQRDLARQLPATVKTLVCGSAPASPWLRVVWEQFVLPRIVRRERADLLLAGFNTSPLFSPAPVVLVAHSVNPYSDLPIVWSRYMVLRHAGLRWLGRRSAAVSRRVVFVSRTAAAVMAPKMGVAPARVRVVYDGWTPPSGMGGAAVPSTLPPRYILTVGDLLAHKNVETLMDAFELLVDETGYTGGLVIAGGVDPASEYGRRLRQRHEQLRHAARMQFVGRIPYPAIAAVYRRADLFALPSLEETFGLPLVEAMGAGVPVVASDWRLNAAGERGRTNVGPEICGTVAEFFDPEDARSMVAAMRRVLETPARRSQLAAEGPARAAEFSWRRAADDLLAVLDEAAAQQ